MKKTFLTFILSLLMIMTTVSPINVFAVDKVEDNITLTSSFGSTDVTRKDGSLYDGVYASGLTHYYEIVRKDGSGTSNVDRSLDKEWNDINAGDVIKASFSIASDKFLSMTQFAVGFLGSYVYSDGSSTEGSLNNNQTLKFNFGTGAIFDNVGDISEYPAANYVVAETGRWNRYEIRLTVGGSTANVNDKLAVYKDGVKLFENESIFAKYGNVCEVTELRFRVSNRNHDETFYMADIKVEHYPVGIETKGFVIEEGSFVKSDGSASVTVENYGTESEDATVVIASYNSDGSLAEIAFDSLSVDPKIERTFEAKLKNGTDGKTMKAFLWDNLTNLTPLSESK